MNGSDNKLSVLVTGGAGYIGAHTIRELLRQGIKVSVFDNFSRGHRTFLNALNLNYENIFEGSLQSIDCLKRTLVTSKPDVVIHFAAFALVGESNLNPGMYWDNNVYGSLNLLRAMVHTNTRNLVFSSSCSVYGNQVDGPITESQPLGPLNPYAFSKYAVERMLSDFAAAHRINSTSLRYFNAAGASHDALIGELHDPETHLIPLVFKSILEDDYILQIYGSDYPTADGTCIRDYIHVEDLAVAHCAAAKRLAGKQNHSTTLINDIYNLGTGIGSSVLQIISRCEQISERKAKYKFSERRAGDPAALVASPAAAQEQLGWVAKHDLNSILQSAWNWQSKLSLSKK